MVNKNSIFSEIRKLNVIERLNIITDIWDEIKESQELTSVSEEDKKILLGRLANYRTNPESATDWTTLKQDIYDRYPDQN
ncbi:MAG: addiction module protein [Deltaproteobacteria bacterium]|nr:addiction module protein [Deltaproteobacteria bacterium]